MFGSCRLFSGNSGAGWNGSHRLASLGGSVCAGAVLPVLGMALAGLVLMAPASGKTLTLTITDVTTVTVTDMYSKIKGKGVLLKKGGWTLDLTHVVNNAEGTIRLQEGGLLIKEGEALGRKKAKLHFLGGTLSFASGSPITLSEYRRIILGNSGTFFASSGSVTVHVDSRLSGSGELRKLGINDLNFRNIDASRFTGTIRLEEGVLVIDDDRDLGKSDRLVFSGGTLRLEDFGAKILNSSLDGRRFVVETEGTFHTDSGASFGASTTVTISGGGTLSKTGRGGLNFRNVDASRFTGDWRLEEGDLEITDDRQLGSEQGKLFLSGGELISYTTVTVAASRRIVVEEDSRLTGWEKLEVQGTISTAIDAILYIRGRVKLTGQANKIGNIYMRGAELEGDSYSLGGSDPTTVSMTPRIFANASEEKPELVFNQEKDGGIRQWLFEPHRLMADGTIVKRGVARLTIANSVWKTGYYDIEIEEGAIVDTGTNEIDRSLVNVTVAAGASLVVELKKEDQDKERIVPIGYHNMYGDGMLVKKGGELLDMSSVRDNLISRLDIREGTVLVDDARDLGYSRDYDYDRGGYYTTGASDLILSGGTVRLENDMATITLEASRLITVATKSAIETATDVVVSSTFAGSGELTKTGSGAMDFRAVHASLFTGLLRLSAGGMVIEESRNLGGTRELIFSGGTLRIDNSLTTAPDVISLTVSRISVETSGALDTRTDLSLKSPLHGSGELKKTGTGRLGFSGDPTKEFRGIIRLEAGMLMIDEGKDLGLASGLAFSGGTLHLANRSVSIVLAQSVTVSADRGHRAFIAFSNTVALDKAFVDRVDKKATVQMSFQGSDARLMLGVDSDTSITLRNWIFQGGETPVIDVGSAMSSTSDMDMTDKLTMKEVGFIGTSPSATVTMGTININRQVGIYSKAKPLDLRGWAVSITGKRRFMLSLASIALTVSTGIKHHFGPRALSGKGFVRKKGDGHLDMSHTDGSGFGGTVNIAGGTMKVGSLDRGSQIHVHPGAMMEGTGGVSVGSVEVRDGGTLYQGASSVALHVEGDYIQKGGTYRVQVRGPSYKSITVSGMVSVAGTLDVVVHPDAAISSSHVVLRTTTTVAGKFTLMHDSTVFSGVTIKYGKNVTVEFERNFNAMYHDYVQGQNGEGTAWALAQIEGRQDGRPASFALLYIRSADQARRALASLSGEMHVSASSALMSSGTLLEDAASGQMRLALGRKAYASQSALRATVPTSLGLADASNAGGGMGIWAKSLEVERRYGGSSNIRAMSYSSSGSLLGFDLPVGSWRAGLFNGSSKAQFSQDSGQSTGSNDSYHAGLYGGRMWDGTALWAGVSYSRHEIRMSRRLHLPGRESKLNSDYRAHTHAVFGQLEHQFSLAGALVEPFVGLSHVRHSTEAFEERGVAGLAIRSPGQHSGASIASAGMGVSGGFQLGSVRMQARGLLSWKRRLGGGSEAVGRQSLGSSGSFDVYGAGSELDSLEVDAGLDVRLGRGVDMSFAYSETDLLDAGGRDGYFRAALVIE